MIPTDGMGPAPMVLRKYFTHLIFAINSADVGSHALIIRNMEFQTVIDHQYEFEVNTFWRIRTSGRKKKHKYHLVNSTRHSTYTSQYLFSCN